jgi:hypothetical protein
MNRYYITDSRELPKNWKHESKDPDVEEAISQWLSVVTGRGVHISCPVLKVKLGGLTKNLGHRDFKATDDGLPRWKLRELCLLQGL